MKNKKYDESSIQILEGLEAVRKRPGMYIGSTDSKGLHHLIWEIVDNSVDEAMAGFANEITVTLEKNNSITVSDNGRGIPIGLHANGMSTPEVIFSILHAGGKFDSNSYKTSGGLHGVGSSVVNALSEEFSATIYRDKKINTIKFKNGGKLKEPLTEIATTNKSGTTINFKPDQSIFKTIEFDFDEISNRLKETAFLNNNLKINIIDKINKQEVTYLYEHGLSEFIVDLLDNKKCISNIINFQNTKNNIEVEIALQFSEHDEEFILGFANNVKTIDGGTHITGFKSGITRAINDYAIKNKIIKETIRLDSNDLREGLFSIISVKIPEDLIEYEGQTKSKLTTPIAKTTVEQITYESMSYWLIENKKVALKIIENAQLAQKAREDFKKSKNLTKQKNKKSIIKQMLGKLTPAQGKKKEINELFLVEGDSAGGSAKSGRDRKYQAILPLRGKVINSEKFKLIELLKNEEIQTIIHAIGGGVGKDFNIKNINYSKIIIMTDADTDGAHIQILLLTFFYRHMRDLIKNNNIYLALPPLFKVTFSNKKFTYFWDEIELEEFLSTNKDKKIMIQRYKGLGEMNSDQLWDTTMNPENRKLINVNIEDAYECEKIFKTLMGEEVDKRKKWIQKNIKFTLEE